jgi:hypothetical protein
MATYCYRCELCGGEFTYHERGYWVCPTGDMAPLVRDYRAEAVGVQVLGLKRERERGGASAVRDMFLPTAKDFAGPTDPDGSKGLRQWGEEHAPKSGNKRPLYPDIPKVSF